ncbi:putative Ig domain-containing protein [Lysobacter korlensis]|uniref:Ig domain-containing protein n=1 Tax=Lysobacter korlensis TaxID=553636 RepID=A0ABV6RNK3_9GAMM
MTAIISGNGLGLFNSSLNQLGGTLGSHPGLGQGTTSQYVNIATGNVIMQGQDERLLSRGLLFEHTRTYNSQGVLTSTNEAGKDLWTFEFETVIRHLSGTINTAGSTVERILGDGTRVRFAYDAQAGLYRSTAGDGAHDTISYSTSSAQWTWMEGSSLRQEIHNSSKGQIVLVRDPKTGAENRFERNTSGRLERIVTQGGDAVLFHYDGSTEVLLGVSTLESGEIKSQVRYGYDSAGRLARIELDLTPGTWDDNNADATRSFVTEYEYSDDGKIKRASRGMSQSDGLEVSYDYFIDTGRVRAITVGSVEDGSAQTLIFAYDTANRRTDVTDAAGRTWSYFYDSLGQLTEVHSPAENGQRQVTKIAYNAAGDVTRVEDAEQRVTAYEYDSRGNLLLQRDASGNTVRRAYDSRNQLLTQASYTVADPDGAGPQQATGALVTRNVYDATGRVAYTVGAEGEVTQHTYDALTGLVGSTLTFHSHRYAVSGLADDQAPSLAQMNAWAAQQLATSVDGAAPITRVDYRYDGRGLLARTFQYGRVDAQGQGVRDAEMAEVVHIYDAQGLLREQVAYRGADRTTQERVSYFYDGLGRLIGTRDAENNITTHVQDDRGQRLVVTQADGLIQTELRDKGGRTTAITQSVAGEAGSRTEHRFHDETGRLRATQDAGGARTYYFYDAVGRVTGEVDVTGLVTEYQRDRTGLLLETRTYATRVDTRTWFVDGRVTPSRISDVRPAADAANDRLLTNRYDGSGRLISQVDAEGLVTAYTYDGASRLIRTTVGKPQDATVEARATRFFYDRSGRQTAVLDAEGYLTERRFDAAGRETALVRYAQRTSAAARATGSLDELRPGTSDSDQITRSFYNARGLKVAELNAEGYLTEFVYDEERNQRGVRVHNRRLDGLSGSESLSTLRAQAQSEGARETRRVFNARGLVATEINAEGTVTHYRYDAAGRLVRTEAAAGTHESRHGGLRFNAFGELIGELSGAGAAELSAREKAAPGGRLTAAEMDALFGQYGIRHAYDALGRRTESVDAEGNKTWYFYDGGSRLTHTVRGMADALGVRNALGEVVETRYDSFGQVIDTTAYTGRIGIAGPFGREQAAQAITTLRYVQGHDSRLSFSYDRRGAVLTATDANGFRSINTYSAFGELTRSASEVEAGRWIATEFDYNLRGERLAQVDDADGVRRTLSQEVDAFGRVVQSHDGRGHVVTRGYDRLGRQVTQSQRIGGRNEVWSTAYDAHGRVLTQTDPLQRATTYHYDDAARSVVVTTPEGVSLRTERTRHGEVRHVTDGAGVRTSYAYDLDGRLLETIDANGKGTVQLRDVRGLVQSTRDATGRTVDYRYDAAGRVLERVEDPRGLALTTRYEYDAQGRQVRVVDPEGVVTRQGYDAAGQLVEVERDVAGLRDRTLYTWDGMGRQLSVTEAAGTSAARTVHYQYDDLGRRTSETLVAGTVRETTQYRYDANDNLVARIDAEQRVSRFAYDEANRGVFEVDPAGGVTQRWHDGAGRLVATRAYAQPAAIGGAPLELSADQIAAAVTADDARDVQMFLVLDGDGRAAFAVDGEGGVTRTQYDAAGRVVQTRRFATATPMDPGQAEALRTGAIAADAFVLPAPSTQDRVEHRVYDAVGRLRYTVDADGSVQRLDYDAAGRATGSHRYVQRIGMDAGLAVALEAGSATEADLTARVTGRPDDLRLHSVLDSAGRVRFTVDAAGNVEEFFFDDAGRAIGSRRYVSPIGVDAPLAERLASGTAGLQDIQGRLSPAAERDLRSFQVLDALGRTRFSIDATGAVREWVLDAAGRVVAARQLATPVAVDGTLSAALADGTASPEQIERLITRNDAIDVREQYVLDGAGRVRFAIAANGAVLETQYDATGLVRAELAHATPLAADRVAAAQAGQLTAAALEAELANSAAGARASSYVRDASGRVRFTLVREDANRVQVREQRYDALGQVTAEVAYGVRIAAGTPATVAAVSEALAAAGGADASAQRITRRVHDAAGRTVYQIDSAGAVTEMSYDGLGRVQQQRSYDRPASTNSATESEVAAQLVGAQTRVTETHYDTAGRVVAVIDALGNAERFEYDGAGQKTAYTNRDEHRWTYVYDAAGRLAREISPQVAVSEVGPHGSVGTAHRSIVTMFEYDAAGNVLARIEDANGSARRTDYAYDNRGRQITTIFPDAGVWSPATGAFSDSGRPTTRVFYDTLDRAVMQQDVRGNYSHRVYDNAGQLRYEVDQEGFVTGYTCNGFGEREVLTRFAQKVALADGQPLTLGQIEGLRQITHGEDRTLTTRYSQLGQKVEVQQDGVTWHDAAGTAHAGRPTTRFEYDAYGQLTRESVLLEGGADEPGAKWAHTHRYYDAAGRQAAVIDAEGYLTALTYSAQGEVLSQTEYARAVSSIPTAGTMPIPPAAGDADTGYDRTTSYGYDGLGRKTSESVTRHAHDHDGVVGVSTVVTTLRYDGEGHAIEVETNGAVTRTSYDALGRAAAVLEPERAALREGGEAELAGIGVHIDDAALLVSVSPYSTMQYDAFGNVVEVRRYANGWKTGAAAAEVSSADQVHVTRYDRQGRAVWERDAAGTEYARTFDAADNVLSTQMRLDGTAGRWARITTLAKYDQLGRQTESKVVRDRFRGDAAVAPDPATREDNIDTASYVRYNAFGEIVAKADYSERLDDAAQSARFEYDRAGRLVRTNAEGGVFRSYGYNLAGQQTLESHDVLLESAPGETRYEAAITLNRLDRLGRVVEQSLPAANDSAAERVSVQRRYDRWGNTVAVRDPRGAETFYQYNELNQAILETRPGVKVVHADGTHATERPTTAWFYDALGRQIGSRDANNNVRRAYYNDAGQLVESRNAYNHSTRQAYDALGQHRLSEDALGYVTYRGYDTAGRVVEHGDYLAQIDGMGRGRTRRESYVLDQNGNRTQVIDALGNKVQYDYDSRGLVVRSRTAAGVVLEFAYDRQGRKVRETNALSDARLLLDPTPVYRGGLASFRVVPQGAGTRFAIPAGMFAINTGDAMAISERVTVERWNGQTSQYEAVPGWSYDVASRTLDGQALPPGNYRLSVVASTAMETSAVASMGFIVLDSGQWAASHWASSPQAALGLPDRAVATGEAFVYTLPAGAFTHPQGQSLTYSLRVYEARQVWVQTYEGNVQIQSAESDGTASAYLSGQSGGYWEWVWDYHDLDVSELAGHLAINAVTGEITGALPAGTYSLQVVAHAGAREATSEFSIGPAATATGQAPSRRAAPRDDQEGRAIWLDEQTWQYDMFGRLTDHNDLSGFDYDYEYDSRTGQQVTQSSDWTVAGRVYSAPTNDYLDDLHDAPWHSEIYDWVQRAREALQTPELLSDPARTVAYYANGQIKEIREGSNWTRYTYDAAGNRTSEESLTYGQGNQTVHQRTEVTYDSHNRIIKVVHDDLGASVERGAPPVRRLLDLRYDYDAVGNRRRVLARSAYGDNQAAIPMTDLGPQVVNAIASQSALVGEKWAFTVPSNTFSDPEGGPLTYTATMADGSAWPAWLTFNPTKRSFSGAPPQAGAYTVRVTVEDSDGHLVSADFVLTAADNRAPEAVGTIAPQTGYTGVPWSFRVPAGTFADPDGRALTYSATMADGSPLPDWLTLTADGRFTGTPPSAESLQIRVAASDGALSSSPVEFTLEVQQLTLPFNMDFEQGNVGWDLNGIQIVQEAGSFDGGWHAKRVYTGHIGAGMHAVGRVPVQVGQVLTVSAMMRAYGAEDEVGGAVRIGWLDANGAQIGYSQGNEVNVVNGGYWRASTITAAAPEGAVFAMLQGGSFCLRPGGVVLFDRFSWQYGSPGDGGGGGGGGGTIGDGDGPIRAFLIEERPPHYAPEDPDGGGWNGGYPGDGDGDGSGWNPDGSYTAPSPYKSYWYSYDAENRVDVVHGDLTDGQIRVSHNGISHSLSYDEAGRATNRWFYQGGAFAHEQTQYTQRGQRNNVFVNGVRTESSEYDGVGRTTQRREYFGAGTVRNGVDISGWIKHAEVYQLDADGRMLRQDIHGRALGWTAYAPPAPPPPPPPPVTRTSGAGAPTLQIAPAGYGFSSGLADYFELPAGTFVDAEGGEIRYEIMSGPTWLEYQRGAEGQHGFYGTPPADIQFAEREVVFRATDAQGNWTEVVFQVTVFNDGDDYPDDGFNPEFPQLPRMVAASMSTTSATYELGELRVIGTVNYGEHAYDKAGRLIAYQYSALAHEDGTGATASDPINFTHTYVYQYEGRDSYLEKQVYGNSRSLNGSTNYFRASHTVSEYDAWGRRVSVSEKTPKFDKRDAIPDRVRTFAYDREGNILLRKEGTLENGLFTQTTEQKLKDDRFAFVSGQQVARGSRSGELDVVGRLTAYNSSEAGAITITVQAGDTLRGIAQRIYGNSNLWYVIAEANAVTDAELRAGTSLKVPDVKVSANDAETFKPYNPAETVGNTSPSLPYITPPPKRQCSGIAAVLAIVVIVVAAIFMPYVLPVVEGIVGAGALATGIATGVSVAAGSAVTQGVGSALGVTSFSWRQVAVDGITAGITAGMGQYLAGTATFGKLAADGTRVLKTAGKVAQAVSTYGGSVVANATVGRDTNFSWKAVAATAASAYIGAAAGLDKGLAITKGTTELGRLVNEYAGAYAGSALNATSRRLMGLGKQDWRQIAIDAFGNTIANAAVRGVRSWQADRIARAQMADQMHDAAWADGNPFNDVSGSSAARGAALRDLSTEVGLRSAIQSIVDANAGQPLFASGYGDEASKLGAPAIMSTDGSGTHGNFTRGESDQSVREMEAELDRLTAQGRDMSNSRALLHEYKQRAFVGDAGLEIDIIGGSRESDFFGAEHASFFYASTSQPFASLGPRSDAVNWSFRSHGASAGAFPQSRETPPTLDMNWNWNWIGGAGLGIGLPNFHQATPIPANPVLPTNGGRWTGVPGNSGWVSTNPKVTAITGGRPVQFRNGMVNFDPWSQGRLNVPGMTGSDSDLRLGRDALRKKYGLPTDAAAKRWLRDRGLTLHHNANGLSLDLIPSDLHNTRNGGIPHSGGASILRNWNASGTPQQFYRANQIARGARYLGGAGAVYGAYTDGASLYSQYKISRQTGSYVNTSAEATRIAGGWAGAWAVGTAGAKFGAGFGAVFGPVGLAAGGVIGGAVGGALGYAAGSYALPRVVDDMSFLNKPAQ